MKKGRIILLWAAVYICVAGFIYFRAKGGFFTADDFYYLKASTQRDFWELISSRQAIGYYFRPLTAASFFLDYHLWTFDFSGYMLFNTTVHLAVSLAVMRFCYEYNKLFVFRESSAFLSGAIGFVFLILPAHSGAIFWIAARSGLLMTLFGLLSLLFYLQYEQTGKTLRLILSVLLFSLALVAKEAALVFIPAIIILDLAQTRDSGLKDKIIRLAILAIPFLATALLFFALRYHIIGRLVGGPYVIDGYGPGLQKFLDNLVKMPIRLFIPPIDNGLSLAAAIMILSAMLITALFFFRGRDWRHPILKPWGLGLLLLMLYVFLSPYLQFGVNMGDVNRERYLYLISVPGLMLLGNVLGAVFQTRPKLAGSVVVLLVAIYIPYFFNALETWKTAGSLARNTVSGICAYGDREKLILVNLPVSYKGAYILPLGLEPGLAVFCQAGGARILELSHHYLTDPESGLEIATNGEVSSYQLNNTGERLAYNVWGEKDKKRLGRYAYLDKSEEGFRVLYNRTDPQTPILYFQAGKIRVQGR